MAVVLCVGCAATGTTPQSQSTVSAELSVAGEQPAQKQSLDKMLDENNRVELVDEETGKTKLICRRQPVLGSRLGSNKVCATKKQWDDEKRQAGENVDQTQRGLSTPPPSSH